MLLRDSWHYRGRIDRVWWVAKYEDDREIKEDCEVFSLSDLEESTIYKDWETQEEEEVAFSLLEM